MKPFGSVEGKRKIFLKDIFEHNLGRTRKGNKKGIGRLLMCIDSIINEEFCEIHLGLDVNKAKEKRKTFQNQRRAREEHSGRRVDAFLLASCFVFVTSMVL